MTQENNPALEYIDFSADRQNIGLWWYEVIDHGLPFKDKVEQLLRKTTILPNANTQTPIFVSLACVPSALSVSLPIGVLYGASGSGKSSAGTLVSYLHGLPTLSGSSTFAAIRNFIDLYRYYDEEKRFERNFILVWDDINEQNFLFSENLFSLFKSGINRKTSKVMIAGKEGKNITFDTFSPKIVSTVNPFWDNPKLVELKRRLLPFHFKSIDFKSLDVELLSVDDILFEDDKENMIKGIHSELETFWMVDANRKLFRSAKTSVSRLKSDVLPLDVKRLYTDVIATAVVLDYGSTKECLTLFEKHYEYVSANVLDSNMGLIKVFESWIKDKETFQYSVMRERKLPSYQFTITPKEAFQYLEECFKNAEIGTKPEKNVTEQLFVALGYVKTRLISGYVWRKELTLNEENV